MDAVPVRGRPRARTCMGTFRLVGDGVWSIVFATTRNYEVRLLVRKLFSEMYELNSLYEGVVKVSIVCEA